MVPLAEHRKTLGTLDDLLHARGNDGIAVRAHQNYRRLFSPSLPLLRQLLKKR